MNTHSIQAITTKKDGAFKGVRLLYESPSMPEFLQKVKAAERAIGGTAAKGRRCRRLQVCSVNWRRLNVFLPLSEVKAICSLLKKTDTFESTEALGWLIKVKAASLRVAMCKARRIGSPSATVRGVTFCYV